ncbi:aromatic-ring hydroxylase C-terminal domain-containing protein [Arthrobacter gallicola]|uniref:aromatic-ring hydroxylase C-terminal domain-containing protein n=1 Tax=Arthrobacter gallicola TaxID=2762225 RepID=UPI00296B1412|nr:hypothetical protein [Arthrobacter gallicola]
MGGDSSLIGRRLPDQQLADGRLYDHMHTGRGILMDSSGQLSAAGWENRVDLIAGSIGDQGGDLSRQPAGTAVLLRPDGHVAWAGGDRRELPAALSRWFGAPAG